MSLIITRDYASTYVQIEVLDSQLHVETFADLAAEPDGLAVPDALPDELEQQVDRLVVVDDRPAADDVTEAVDRVRLVVHVRRSRVGN